MSTETRTTNELRVLVGEDKAPLLLTDMAVEAVQAEAAGRMVDAMANAWAIQKDIEPGNGFDSLHLGDLLALRDHLQLASELVEVLIECRPLDELDETG